MLKDDAAFVRMRVALSLALAREQESVPVRIDLLPVLPGDQVGHVEDALLQLASDTAPEVSLGTEPADSEQAKLLAARLVKRLIEKV